MNNFEIEQKACKHEGQKCIENQRNLAMELHRAADAGNVLSNMTERLFCVLFGGGMAERNCCDQAQSFSEDLDRHVDTLCRTCELMERILTMVG
ncbi:MAG: hypothetical protein ACI3VQ_00185 [Faecousia sp.]